MVDAEEEDDCSMKGERSAQEEDNEKEPERLRWTYFVRTSVVYFLV